MLVLYDAARCPFAARVRIVLAEKGVEYEAVEIDLDDRPAWLYAKNPLGKVPVIEEDGGLVLPESRVIMEYLDERYPEPALLPVDPAERALARLRLERFDAFSRPYYAVRRRENGALTRLDAELRGLDEALEAQSHLGGRAYGLADIAYLPWIVRAQHLLGIELETYPALAGWLERLAERPAVAAELDVVATL